MKILKILNIPSSTWYEYVNKKNKKLEDNGCSEKTRGCPRRECTNQLGESISDEEVIIYLKTLREKKHHNKLGYRKLTHLLRRDYKLIINHKKVYRLYSEASLTLSKKKKIKRRGKKICENRSVDAPNKLWEFDIKYGYIAGENRFFYLMTFLDVFTREPRAYHLGLRCTAKDILLTLEEALNKHNVNIYDLVIRSDNGPQMTSYRFKKKMTELGLTHEFIPPKTPNLNAHIESFHSIVDRELFQGKEYGSFSDAFEDMVSFMEYYTNVRPHGSLKMMTPKEFAELNNDDKKDFKLTA